MAEDRETAAAERAAAQENDRSEPPREDRTRNGFVERAEED